MKHRNRRNRYLPITGIVIFSFGGLLLVNSTTASADTNTAATAIKNTPSTTPAKPQTPNSAFLADNTPSSASVAKTPAPTSASSITPHSTTSSTANKSSISAAATTTASKIRVSGTSNSTSSNIDKPSNSTAPTSAATSNQSATGKVKPNNRISSIQSFSAATPLQSSATSSTPSTDTKDNLTMQVSNVPTGVYYDTNNNVVPTHAFINGARLYAPQDLPSNTVWSIKQIATDQDGTTFYNLGDNEWVPGSTSNAFDFDNTTQVNSNFQPLTPVSNMLKNTPIVLSTPITFHLHFNTPNHYPIFDIQSEKFLTNYAGPLDFKTNTYYVASNNITWLKYAPNEWFDLSGDADNNPMMLTSALSTTSQGFQEMISGLQGANAAVDSINNTLASTHQP
ncbi:hypothetical protein MUDAN_DOGOELCO_00638 [Lactiplantibacillus mudanjiangensis]|uniref:hypothetical protein n=1 Tax=Lactiplantibacillus mudanjiangensis TaxID=1296538 RepID=UPI0010145DFF|nr:hypothetical protein [Lactiplantibacillus mudanjiangensis]VDG31137.1 hypothetical protein MUDAN_DOGOELCO_00638 [Lactiplantibacillus mudanjiangensis]